METIAGDAVGRVMGLMMSEIVTPALAVLLILAALVYLIPTFAAFIKRRDDRTNVMLVNVLWGWTVVGWFIALARALRKSGRPARPGRRPPSSPRRGKSRSSKRNG